METRLTIFYDVGRVSIPAVYVGQALMAESRMDLLDNVHPGGYTVIDSSSEVGMCQVMSASRVRRHLGEVMRRVASGGEPVIVERGGKPLVAVISLADLQRLQEACAGELSPENQAALTWLDRWENASDVAGPEWWTEFERDLCEHPVVFGKDD